MGHAPEPLTLEEHRELAEELLSTSARLRELRGLVAKIYGAESRPALTFTRAAESLDRLRREMQSQAAADCPEAAGERIYG